MLQLLSLVHGESVGVPLLVVDPVLLEVEHLDVANVDIKARAKLEEEREYSRAVSSLHKQAELHQKI